MIKMNRKGFTLIEMLVVIAIIAILVAIIMPIVLYSNTRAKAATDAANLRSVIAEASISMQDVPTFTYPTTGSADIDPSWYTYVTSASGDGELHVVISYEGVITAYFGSPTHDVAYYSEIAGMQ